MPLYGNLRIPRVTAASAAIERTRYLPGKTFLCEGKWYAGIDTFFTYEYSEHVKRLLCHVVSA